MSTLNSRSPWCLRGISLNINGINDISRLLFDTLFSTHNVIALQETKFSSSDNVRRATHFAHVADAKAKVFWSHNDLSRYDTTQGRNGVGILFSGSHPFISLADVTMDYCSDADMTVLRHRYMVIEAKVNDSTFFFHVIYAPVQAQDRRTYFDTLPIRFPDSALHIALGDFNLAVDATLDSSTATTQDAGHSELQTWALQLGVLDAWRATYPDRRQFTGPGRRNRIDYCFVSLDVYDTLLRSIRHATDMAIHHADHVPVVFALESRDYPPQSRLPWKCPRWILQNPTVQAVLEHTCDDLASRLRCGSSDNPGALLDEHKRQDGIWLRKMVQSFKSTENAKLRQLQQSLHDAQTLQAHTNSQESREAIENAKAELKAMQEHIKSRREQNKFDQEVRDGETGTSRFLSAPSTTASRVSIPCVQRPDGSETVDNEEMAAAHRRFWCQVFQSPSRDVVEEVPRRHYQPIELQRLLAHTTARLSSIQQAGLDAPLTANDFYWAIRTSPKGKSCGLDGIPAEYYQLFPEKWARIYELVYAAQVARGRMSKFQRRAYISLLYKKGDRADPGNYRPITLLNHDAKFGPKILAFRLRSVLPELIHQDQFGFIPGRSIRHALVSFQDLQQYCREAGLTSAGAISVDFEKAFDSVLWPALDFVLRHLGFGSSFRKMIQTFYNGTLVTVLVNGTASKFFELGGGVRQGDPLSPALFVLFIEPMLNYLRYKGRELGVLLPDTDAPQHIVAFADDCTGILSDLGHADDFISSVRQYADSAGLRLNVSKTQVMPFTKCDTTTRTRLETAGYVVIQDTSSMTLLGIPQSPTLPANCRFDRLLPAMVARCQLWKYRARTIRGRAVILRTIVLPLFWYTAAVTPVPAIIATRITNLCKAFLFKREISTDRGVVGNMPVGWLHTPSSFGGLGLPDIATFARTLQLCTLRDATRHCSRKTECPRWAQPAVALFNRALDKAGHGFDILHAAIPKSHPAPAKWRCLGVFWHEVLITWNELRNSPHNTTQLACYSLEVPLWRNAKLVVGALERPFEVASTLAHHFRDNGYICVRDFVSRHGSLPTTATCKQLLQDDDFASPRLRSLAASHFVNQLTNWGLLTGSVTFGPSLPPLFRSALHGWSYRGTLFVNHTNRSLYRLLHKLPVFDTMPNVALAIDAAPDWKTCWRAELSLDKFVLPVLSDLKYRLQHNALSLRKKHAYHTNDTRCPHGCLETESAKHLFWTCDIAARTWESVLLPIDSLCDQPITWSAVAYMQQLQFTKTAVESFGTHNLRLVFHVIRCATLYPIWLHRNDRIYQVVTPSAVFTTSRASAYIRLHLKRLADCDTNPRLVRLCTRMLEQFQHATR